MHTTGVGKDELWALVTDSTGAEAVFGGLPAHVQEPTLAWLEAFVAAHCAMHEAKPRYDEAAQRCVARRGVVCGGWCHTHRTNQKHEPPCVSTNDNRFGDLERAYFPGAGHCLLRRARMQIEQDQLVEAQATFGRVRGCPDTAHRPSTRAIH